MFNTWEIFLDSSFTTTFSLTCLVCSFDFILWFTPQHSLNKLYEIRYTYNKNLLMQYNSTQGNWKGFTEFGVDRARMYNVDPEDAKLRKIEQMIFINIFVLESMYAAPSLKLSTVKQSSHTEPALLLCSAYNFYPQEIQMTWLLNGQEVTSAVTSTDILYNGNLYYQIHSYLEHRPKPGEEFSCMVEHVTLRDPLLKIWELHPPLPWSERVKIAVGTFFLAVGLTALITGFIKHKKVTAVLTGQDPCRCYILYTTNK
uniref:Ig-like domain-containing protein n=1 Tax=Periophthalmus magnuspinnatus TaxID=409849 RepID=A0A3B4A1G3_9GOBI